MTTGHYKDLRVLLLPGWLNSDPGHWQSHWERRHGWQPTIYDATQCFATYGRGTVPLPATPRRTLATAVRT